MKTMKRELQSLSTFSLAAILAADVVGYSRMMGENEEATLATLSKYRQLIDGLIQNHRGRIFGTAGDSVIAEFSSSLRVIPTKRSGVGKLCVADMDLTYLPTCSSSKRFPGGSVSNLPR